MKKLFSILLLGFVCAGNIFGADALADFSAANKLYAEGKFSDAASAYEKILMSGEVSANLLFNYGNAKFKSGHLGKAIAAYRRANLLNPRDAEIRANLAFARQQVSGATSHPARWQSWFSALSLNEWTILAAFSFWLVFFLFIVRQLRPSLTPRLKNATTLLIVLTVFLGAVLGLQAASHFADTTAVVISAEATTRSGPFDEAQSVFTVHDGAELQVQDQHDDWIQVADGTGKTGWLNRKQVEVLLGA